MPASTRFWQARGPAPHSISSLTNAGASGVVRPREAHEIEHEIHHVIGHGHFADDLLQLEDLRSVDHRLDLGVERAGGARDDLPLLLAIRVIDFHEKDEAIALRLGQRIGAFLLDRILRREHEERLARDAACGRQR